MSASCCPLIHDIRLHKRWLNTGATSKEDKSKMVYFQWKIEGKYFLKNNLTDYMSWTKHYNLTIPSAVISSTLTMSTVHKSVM